MTHFGVKTEARLRRSEAEAIRWTGHPGFFDVDERLKELSAKGDDLERLNGIVDFEMFRADLERAVPRSDRAKGGRPPYDHVLMFKVLILQSSHSLSDERTEYLIKDRLSFMRFLGLSLAQSVPDANSIWNFREALTRASIEGKPAIEVLFKRFDAALTKAGFLAMGGQIIDATIVAAPKQRNTEAEKKDDQGRPHSRGLEAQARQTAPEGSRRAMDGQILESQAVRGRREARRSGDPRLRLQEPYRHRPRPWPDPDMDGDGRLPPRRRAIAESHRQAQHRQRRLGGHRLSLGEERRAFGRQRPCAAKSTARSPRASRCPRPSPGPMARSRRSALSSNTSSRGRKGPMGLVIRTIGLARAKVKIGLANLTYNMKRAVWLSARTAAA